MAQETPWMGASVERPSGLSSTSTWMERLRQGFPNCAPQHPGDCSALPRELWASSKTMQDDRNDVTGDDVIASHFWELSTANAEQGGYHGMPRNSLWEWANEKKNPAHVNRIWKRRRGLWFDLRETGMEAKENSWQLQVYLEGTRSWCCLQEHAI